MTYDLKLTPIHYASVSGGKDSLYMLGLILANLWKYPLQLVVHFELEIDWEWSKRVVDAMEAMCKEAGIPFMRIKPRKTWAELFEKHGYPNAKARWCNSEYKLDCKKQLDEWILAQNCRPVAYIGLCADEKQRFKYEIGDWENQDVCYPLAEEGIEESKILEWAKYHPLFEGYYKYFKRQGCKFCPMASMKEMAYLQQVEPESYAYMVSCIKQTEEKYNWKFRGEGIDIIDKRISTKWKNKLEYEQSQIDMFEYFGSEMMIAG